MKISNYRGRFAPSPTGLLHLGSLVTAMASWLDAKAVNGQWLIRIEDVDTTRIEKNASSGILNQLALFGLISEEKVIYQSQRSSIYQRYLESLHQQGLIYPCSCSRKKIHDHYQHLGIQISPYQELIYPGFCRTQSMPNTNHSLQDLCVRAMLRICIPPNTIIDGQSLNESVGDFVLLRADGIFSYQLAVVVDDALQNITHIVRGEDLLTNTPRQKWLQQLLGFSPVDYLHIPLVMDSYGNKLSKQTLAEPIWPKNDHEVLIILNQVAKHLQLDMNNNPPKSISEWYEKAIFLWKFKRPSQHHSFN